MKLSINSTEKSVKKELAKGAKSLEMEDIVDWKSTTWSHLIAITAGLKPFTDPAIGIIPEVFRAFLPSIDYTPSAVDRKNAASILKKALHLVNVATVEYTKVAYNSIFQGAMGGLMSGLEKKIPGGIDQFLDELVNNLNDYETRKMYVQSGLAMMSDEQAWVGKLHTFGVGVMGIYDADPERILTPEEFFSFAYDLGMLQDGAVTYDPLNPTKEALSPDQLLQGWSQTMNQAAQLPKQD